MNDRFSSWFKKASPGERNDHGEWNGQNLLGLDPRQILLDERSQGAKFSLLNFVPQPDRTLPRGRAPHRFLLAETLSRADSPQPTDGKGRRGRLRNRAQLQRRAVRVDSARRVGNQRAGAFQLISVNETEEQKNPCRRLVTKKGSRWELASHGIQALELLTY